MYKVEKQTNFANIHIWIIEFWFLKYKFRIMFCIDLDELCIELSQTIVGYIHVFLIGKLRRMYDI